MPRGPHTAKAKSRISAALAGRAKSLEMRAALSATRSYPRGSPEWRLFFAAKLRELRIREEVLAKIRAGASDT